MYYIRSLEVYDFYRLTSATLQQRQFAVWEDEEQTIFSFSFLQGYRKQNCKLFKQRIPSIYWFLQLLILFYSQFIFDFATVCFVFKCDDKGSLQIFDRLFRLF